MTQSQFLNVQLTSERLQPGHTYTRRQLRDEFSVPRSMVITACFLPPGFSSIWIFLADQEGADGLEILRLNAEKPIQLLGTVADDTARLLAQHQARGLELLVFLRRQTESGRPLYDYLGAHTSSLEGGLCLVPTAVKAAAPMGKVMELQPHPPERTNVHDRQEAIVPRGVYGLLPRECAITGSKVDLVLVATPIELAFPAKLEDGLNALMLRADVAELFARNLVAVDPKSMTVRVSRALAGSEYGLLRDVQLFFQPPYAPSRAALAAHLSKLLDA